MPDGFDSNSSTRVGKTLSADYVETMPPAKPQSPPIPPAPLSDDEVIFIKNTVKRFFGDDAIVRNYGPDPANMALHIETDRDIGVAQYDCFGLIMARIDRVGSGFVVTRRGTRIYGRAKIAYRQGVVL